MCVYNCFNCSSNSFYGELWGTLSNREVDSWLLTGTNEGDSFEQTIETPPLSAGESLIDLTNSAVERIFNVSDNIHSER